MPIEFHIADLAAQEPDMAELKKIYKELEFYSLLKELGPAEDRHTRDYAIIAGARSRPPRMQPSWQSSIRRSRSRLRFDPARKATCR